MSQQQLTIKTPSVARLWFVLGVLGVMLLLLAFRAFDLHVLQHEFLANQGEKRNLRSEPLRSEERRVGKECRSRGATGQEKKREKVKSVGQEIGDKAHRK